MAEKLKGYFTGIFVKSTDAAGGESYNWTMSTECVDRDGESIKVAGWKTDNYNKNPVLLWAHGKDGRPAIAKCEKAIVENGKLMFKNIQFAARPAGHQGEWFPDTVKSLVDQNIIKAGSCGFLPITRNYNTDGKPPGGERVSTLEADLLEGSICNVGCNPEALRQLGISDYAIKSVMGEDDPDRLAAIEKKLDAIFEVLDVMAKNIDNKEKQTTAKSIIAQILDGEADGLNKTGKKKDADEKPDTAKIIGLN